MRPGNESDLKKVKLLKLQFVENNQRTSYM